MDPRTHDKVIAWLCHVEEAVKTIGVETDQLIDKGSSDKKCLGQLKRMFDLVALSTKVTSIMVSPNPTACKLLDVLDKHGSKEPLALELQQVLTTAPPPLPDTTHDMLIGVIVGVVLLTVIVRCFL